MLAGACDWRLLIKDPNRPGVISMLRLVWIRESVNNLLPVGRIGGEIVSFRLMRLLGINAVTAVASLVVDLQLAIISQVLFTLVGVGFLIVHFGSPAHRLAGDLIVGIAALTPFLIIFSVIQHAKPFERLTHLLNSVMGGKLTALISDSTRVDSEIKSIWGRPNVVSRFVFFWQPILFLTTSLEIWVAIYFLGARLSFMDAVMLESLIQAASSAAFFVPAGLGVQEGSFIVVGAALGLDPTTCLALAGSRRIRDLLVFLPGLLAWHFGESSAGTRKEIVDGADC